MQVKNLKRYFTFEVTIMDDKNMRRRFRASNYQSETRVKDSICTMPMRLDDGWNQIQFNLAEFTKRAYGQSALCQSLCICCSNCRSSLLVTPAVNWVNDSGSSYDVHYPFQTAYRILAYKLVTAAMAM